MAMQKIDELLIFKALQSVENLTHVMGQVKPQMLSEAGYFESVRGQSREFGFGKGVLYGGSWGFWSDAGGVFTGRSTFFRNLLLQKTLYLTNGFLFRILYTSKKTSNKVLGQAKRGLK